MEYVPIFWIKKKKNSWQKCWVGKGMYREKGVHKVFGVSGHIGPTFSLYHHYDYSMHSNIQRYSNEIKEKYYWLS